MNERIGRLARRAAMSTISILGLPELFRPRGAASAQALLFHRFFFDGESRAQGIDRLRRQLEWLRGKFSPISMRDLVEGMRGNGLPDRSMLVTADDALIDLLDVADEFVAFEVPLSVFVCSGWTAHASRKGGSGVDCLARAASAIQWYEGPERTIRFGRGRSFRLSDREKPANIDRLLDEKEELLPDLPEFLEQVEANAGKPRSCCTWSELLDLASKGIEMGAHSVTHIRMSEATPIRLRFEIAESKRLCDSLLRPCRAFAYPYGFDTAHNEASRRAIVDAGYGVAFLTHSDFISETSDPFTMPRIALPDIPLSFGEFRDYARGAGIVTRRLRPSTRSLN